MAKILINFKGILFSVANKNIPYKLTFFYVEDC